MRRWLAARDADLDALYGHVVVNDLGLESVVDVDFVELEDLVSAGVPHGDAQALLEVLRPRLGEASSAPDAANVRCADLIAFCRSAVDQLDALSIQKKPSSSTSPSLSPSSASPGFSLGAASPSEIDLDVVAEYVGKCVHGNSHTGGRVDGSGRPALDLSEAERSAATEAVTLMAVHPFSPSRANVAADGFAPQPHLLWTARLFHLICTIDAHNPLARHNLLVARARLASRAFAERNKIPAASSREAALDEAIFWAVATDNCEPTSTGLARLVVEFGVYEGVSLRRIAHVFGGSHAREGGGDDNTINDDIVAQKETDPYCFDVHAFDSWLGLPEDWVQTPLSVQRAHQYSLGGKPPLDELWPPRAVPHPGWFNTTVPTFVRGLADESAPLPPRRRFVLAFVHVDCDLYQSTLDALGPLAEAGLLAGPTGDFPGTVLFFDEYFGYPGWERHESQAWDEIAARHGIAFEFLHYFGQRVAVRVVAVRGS